MEPLQIGVCSWSLKMPDIGDALVAVKKDLGLNLVQIGFWDEGFRQTDRIIKLIERTGLEVSATCIGFEGEDYSSIQRIAETGGFKPDNEWPQRLAKTKAFADFTAALNVKMLACHIGFVPHDKSDPKYAIMVDRLKQVCDVLAHRDLVLVMETGQERAEDLLDFIDAVERDNIRINFDPANMILYGVGDPLAAVELLKDKIVHCHMKDAVWSKEPTRTWGEEVVLGTGQAGIPKLVARLRSLGYKGPLVIEREAGDQRIADIKAAIQLLEKVVG